MKHLSLPAAILACQFLHSQAWGGYGIVSPETMKDGCGGDSACEGSVDRFSESRTNLIKTLRQTKVEQANLSKMRPPSGAAYAAQKEKVLGLQNDLRVANERAEAAYRDLAPIITRTTDPSIKDFTTAETDVNAARQSLLNDRSENLPDLTGRLEGLRPEYLTALDARNALTDLDPSRLTTNAAVTNLDATIAAAPETAAKELAQNGIAVNNKSANFSGGLGGGAQITDPKKAKDYLDKTLARNPNNPDALALRGVTNAQFGNNAAACADSKAALSLNGTDRLAYSTAQLSCPKGTALPALRSPPPTRNYADQTPPPGQRTTEVGTGTGNKQGPGGNTPMDLKGSGASPDSSLSKSLLQQALEALRKGNRNLALDLASSANQSDPHNIDAWLLRMAALKASGEFPTVISDAITALKFNPNTVKFMNEKAYAQIRTQDYKGALETAELALAIDPTNAQALANKAFALGGLGDREGMLAALKTAASLDPQFQASLDAVLKGTGNVTDLFALLGKQQATPPANAGRREALRRLIVAGAIVLLIGFSSLIARSRRLEASGLGTRTPLPAAVSTTPPPASMPAAPSSGRLRGKYELGPQIGAGGMGVVFEGKDVPLDRKVAIKKMLPQLAAQEKLRERFVAEAKTVAALHHPNIVDIHDIVEENQDIYLVFEYVAGKTLSDLLAEKGRFPFFEATKIIHDIAEALEFAHGKNIVHRDLKPSNVMINESGRVIVMDFGLARAAKDLLSQAALTNTIVGTPAYMAPEQEEGVVCKQSDVYSLAVCLYELLSGKRPFDGSPGAMMVSKLATSFKPISKQVSGLPAGIDIFFICALAADPKTRPATPKELLSALENMTPAPAART